MIKTVQKIVLTAFLLSSAHNVMSAKHSHIPLVTMSDIIPEETTVAEWTAIEVKGSDFCATSQKQEVSSMYTQGFGSTIIGADQRLSDVSHQSSKPHWQNNVIPLPHNHILSGYARMQVQYLAHMAAVKKFEQIIAANFAQMKANVSDFEHSFAMRVLDRAQKITASYDSLALNEMLAKKDALHAQKEWLEKERESIFLQNPKVCHPYSEYKQGWTSNDYCDALQHLEIRCAIESITRAIINCDKKLVAFEQNCEQSFCNSSSDVLENEVIPDLIARKEFIRQSVDQITDALSGAEKELCIVKEEEEAFQNRSTWTKFKAKFHKAGQTGENLRDARSEAEERVKELERNLQSLGHQEIICDIELKSAYKVLEKQKQETQRTPDLESYYLQGDEGTIALSRDLQFLEKQYELPQTYLCEGINSAIVKQRERACSSNQRFFMA